MSGENEATNYLNLHAVKRSLALLVERGDPQFVPLCQIVQDVLRDGLAAGAEDVPADFLAKMVGQQVLLVLAAGCGGFK